MNRVYIGTSGWVYKEWQKHFYPEDLPARRQFQFYATQFPTVEINATFYRLPELKTVKGWRNEAPAGFIFAAKGSRFLTHMKKLKDPAPALAVFIERAVLLGPHLGPILFQLPPRWAINLDRLREVLEVLPAGRRCAFEFRDPSWFVEPVFRLLERYRAALCIYHIAGRLAPVRVTTDLVYLRLHGPDGAYAGSYDDATLARWAEEMAGWAAEGRAVHCYFDNDQAGYAAHDALRLRAMLGAT